MKKYYTKTILITKNLQLFIMFDIDMKHLGITIFPSLIFSKSPEAYNLALDWLTLSFQLEYSRKNHHEE